MRGNIFNPSRADYVAASDTCIQCHSQGRPLITPIEGKYYDWPVGYQVGSKLKDYWKLEERTFGATDFYYFPDGTAHKNRMQGNDFVQSVMYSRGITCFNCHDVHGTNNYAQLIKPADKLCLDCHGPLYPNGPRTATLEEHTHHKNGSAGSQCIGCHMPQIETEGVPNTFVAFAHFPLHHSRNDGQVWNFQPLHFVPQRQIHGMGKGGNAFMARTITVATSVGSSNPTPRA
jgi:predicted CXXCH cytochrome family protein